MTFDWWTFGLQAVNVAVLVWLLRRFFWQPVAGIIAQRRAATQTLLGEAADKQAQAAAALAEVAKARQGIAAERDTILTAALAEAEATKAALLQEGKDRVQALRETAKQAIAAETAQAQTDNQRAAATLALGIAQRLAARLTGPAVQAAFLDWLTEAIHALPDRERQALQSAELVLVSASKVDAKGQAKLAKALAAALGATLSLSFRTDPALIEGYELRSPHFTLRNSWQADLEQIAAAAQIDEAPEHQQAKGQPDAA